MPLVLRPPALARPNDSGLTISSRSVRESNANCLILFFHIVCALGTCQALRFDMNSNRPF